MRVKTFNPLLKPQKVGAQGPDFLTAIHEGGIRGNAKFKDILEGGRSLSAVRHPCCTSVGPASPILGCAPIFSSDYRYFMPHIT